MWRFDTNIKQYLPDWYRDILDLDEICDSESKQFKLLAAEINAVADNFFLSEMDMPTVESWEKILGIVANPATETLDFRRERIKNQISMTQPFTIRFLRKKLDDLLGEGSYQAYCDYPNYTLYIEYISKDASVDSEISFLVGKTKPAHIVFVQKPIDLTKIFVYGNTAYKIDQWNYKLGSWFINENTSFSSQRTKGVAAFMDIKNQYLQSTANESVDIANYAMLNDNIRVDNLIKTTENNIVNVRFVVNGLTTRRIEKIELYDAEDRLLAVQSAYIPVMPGDNVDITCRFLYETKIKMGV